MTTTSFKSHHGKYWNAYFGGGKQGVSKNGILLGFISSKSDEVLTDETFEVEVIDIENQLITIKSFNGQYVCAESGGGSILIANREYPDPGPWETFKYEIVDDANNAVALRVHNGMYVAAEEGGDIIADRNYATPGPWEIFQVGARWWDFEEPEVPIDQGNRVPSGIVKLNRRVLTDDNGPFLSIGASFFWAPRAYKDYPDEFHANMAYLSENGFNFYRALVLTGGWDGEDAWVNAGSFLPWALEVLPKMLDEAYNKYNLRCSLTLFDGEVQTPTDGEQDGFVRSVCDILRPRMHTLSDVQVANEYGPCQWDYPKGVERLRRHAVNLREMLGPHIPISISSRSTAMSDGSAQEVYAECHKLFDGLIHNGVVTATCNHDSRECTKIDGHWRHVRQGWERVVHDEQGNQLEPDASIDDEPMGPASSVAAEESPSLIIQKMLVSFVSGRHQYCYHTDSGIWGDKLNDAYKGTMGMHKLIEDHTASGPVGRSVLILNDILPPDISIWSRTRHGIKDHPFAKSFDQVGDVFTQIWPDGVTNYGVVRAYCAFNGNDFVVPLTGVKSHFDMKWSRAMTFKIYKCSDMSVMNDTDANSNGQYTLYQEIDTDYLVIGKYK